MTILNVTNDGLYNVLIVIVRTIVAFGPTSRDSLIASCGGGAHGIDKNQVRQTLNKWLELGLLVEDGNDKTISISDEHAPLLGKQPDKAEAVLPKAVRATVFKPENNPNFWEQEESKASDLTRGIAWILAQNIYNLDSTTEALNSLQNSQTKSTVFQNDSRITAAKYWMKSLGFAREMGSWIVDPTEAIRQELPEIFGESKQYTATQFIAQAAQRIPVLDGGTYRSAVEEKLNPESGLMPIGGRVSYSLSLAILRLDRAGDIRIEKESDSEALTLLASSPGALREISHITFTTKGRS